MAESDEKIQTMKKEAHSGSLRSAYALGKYSEDHNRSDLAIYFYKLAIQNGEKDNTQEKNTVIINATLGLGRMYTVMEASQKANESFLKVLELDDKNYDAYFGIGAICYEKKDYFDAKTNFKKALSIKHTVCANAFLGYTYLYLNRKWKALESFGMALAENPRDDFIIKGIKACIKKFNL